MKKVFALAAVTVVAASLTGCILPPPDGYRGHYRGGRYDNDRGGRYDNDQGRRGDGRWQQRGGPDGRSDGRWDSR